MPVQSTLDKPFDGGLEDFRNTDVFTQKRRCQSGSLINHPR
jgi:hypothetical protein